MFVVFQMWGWKPMYVHVSVKSVRIVMVAVFIPVATVVMVMLMINRITMFRMIGVMFGVAYVSVSPVSRFTPTTFFVLTEGMPVTICTT